MDLLVTRKLTTDPEITQINFQTWDYSKESSTIDKAYTKARGLLAGLDVIHFPLHFPEVFVREAGCFDVVVGNPPWQKIKTREDSWLSRYFPGLKGMRWEDLRRETERIFSENPDLCTKYLLDKKRSDYMRDIILSGNYPGIGAGDPDYFMAFAWRFIALAKNNGGRMGVVMPRTICNSAGTFKFRKMLFDSGWPVTLSTLENKSQWAFREVDGRYTIALLDIHKSAQASQHINYLGHQESLEEFVSKTQRVRIHHKDLYAWSPQATIPIIHDKDVHSLLSAFYQHPRLSDKSFWYAHPYNELHVTKDRGRFHNASEGKRDWLVYRGKNVDIWDCDANSKDRLWADSDELLDFFQEKTQRASSSSMWSRFTLRHQSNPNPLPCLKARIAYRTVSRATDRRTMRACLIPPRVFLASTGSLLFPSGDAKDEAYLIGILSSMPLDWLVRRFIEVNVTFDVIKYLPIPRLCRSSMIWSRIVKISGKLAAKDGRFSEWASHVGVEAASYSEDEKIILMSELDALVAMAYELSEKQLIYIYDTFHGPSQHYYKEQREKSILYYRKLSGRT